MTQDLYARQIRLREVGLSGQRRLAESDVTLGTDGAARVAADYLTRSGVGCVRSLDSLQSREFSHAQHFSNDISRQFAHGCWLATTTLTGILGFSLGTDPKH